MSSFTNKEINREHIYSTQLNNDNSPKILTVMLMKYFAIFLVFSSFKVFASNPPQYLINNAKVIYHVCDSAAFGEEACYQITQRFLERYSSDIVERHSSPVCQMPNDRFCDSPDIIVPEVHIHVVFDADDNTVQKQQFYVQQGYGGDASISKRSLTPNSSEYSIGDGLFELESILKTSAKRFTFNQQDNGVPINLLGETMSQVFNIVQTQGASTQSDDFDNAANCQTMLDYQHNARSDGVSNSPRCGNMVNNFINNTIGGEHKSEIMSRLRTLQAQLDFGFASITAKGSDNIDFQMRFKDGSFLVITVKLNDPDIRVDIIVNKDASLTSTGRTLRQHESDLTRNNPPNEFSTREAMSFASLIGNTNCLNYLRTIGYRQLVRIEVTERDENGNPTRFKITLLSQEEVTIPASTC